MLIAKTVLRIRWGHAGSRLVKAIPRNLKPSRKSVRKAIWAQEWALDCNRTVCKPLPRTGPFQERPSPLKIQHEALPRRDRRWMTRIHARTMPRDFKSCVAIMRKGAIDYNIMLFQLYSHLHAVRNDAGTSGVIVSVG